MKLRLILGFIFIVVLLFFCFYDKEEYPIRYNFLNMSRMDVLSWINSYGRMDKYSFIDSDDELWNKIEIRKTPETFIFNDISEVLKDDYVMELNEWNIGGQSISGGRLYYKLIFDNDIVVDQSDRVIKNL